MSGSIATGRRHRSGINPNLGGITAVAIGADTAQRVTAQWQLLQRDIDYYVDPSGVWFALAARLDPNDYLAVSYRSPAGPVGTFPAQDTPVPLGTAAAGHPAPDRAAPGRTPHAPPSGTRCARSIGWPAPISTSLRSR